MNDEPTAPTTPGVISTIPALPYTYDENDSRVVSILNTVAEFCGHEFTVVPPDPDGEKNPETGEIEGGVPVPLAEDEEEKKLEPGDPGFVIDPSDPDKTGQIDPDQPGENTAEMTDELDKLREAYNEAKAQNLTEKEGYWGMLWQVIRLISNLACWTESDDDTFIMQYRKQINEAVQLDPRLLCGPCALPPIAINLLYAPLDKRIEGQDTSSPIDIDTALPQPFIGGMISGYFNGELVRVKIPQEYLNSHYDPSREKVYINYRDFPELIATANKCCCIEPASVDITLWYNAGYLNIPNALLPLVCQLMSKIEDATQSLNDCPGAMTQVAGLLQSKKVGNIQYTWSDKDTEMAKTQALFTQLYNLANVAELTTISRCGLISVEDAGDVI